jgi:hypothetical protein
MRRMRLEGERLLPSPSLLSGTRPLAPDCIFEDGLFAYDSKVMALLATTSDNSQPSHDWKCL